METSLIESFIWSFLGIVVESLPFIIIGSIVSAVIQMFLTEDIIRKCIPKISIFGYLGAIISGVLFPICECAIIPITRSLIKKGLPVGIGISFMLAVPIVNPIVVMSTYYAFPDNISIVILRVVGGAIVALLVGLIMGYLYKGKSKDIFLRENTITIKCDCCVSNNKFITSKWQKFLNLMNHGSNEFLNISVYFILGAFISSLFTTLINSDVLAKITPNNFVGISLMMVLSFLLSLCSEADAFVAKGFLDNFGVGAIIAFLVIGPMMDLKNAFLAFGAFKNKFVIRLIFIITILVLLLGLVITVI